jgi:DNA-binding beta-propeller fold protein YncE
MNKYFKNVLIIFALFFCSEQLVATEKKFVYVNSFADIKTDYPISQGDFLLPYGTVIDDDKKIVYITDCPTGVINVYNLDGKFLYRISKKCKSLTHKDPDCFRLPADINFVGNNNELVLSDEDTDYAYIIKNNEITESYNLRKIGVSYFLGVDYSPQRKSFYVVSSETGEIYELDRKFKIKKKIGYNGTLNSGFSGAYYLKYHNEKLFVVDQTNSRIKIYDADLNLIHIIGKKKICSPRNIIRKMHEFIFINNKKNFINDLQSIFTCYEESNHELAFTAAHEIDIDNKGNIYIADTLNDRVKIYSAKFKLIKILTHQKIKKPKIVSISKDGSILLVGGNDTKKAVHKFVLN